MSDQFVAEIRVVPYTFAPKGWAFCDGQLLPVQQNTALFSLLGTTYGGDGDETFGLPNIQSQVVVGPGEGPGLSQYFLGETVGAESVYLLQSEIPSHNHRLMASSDPGDLEAPAPGRALAGSRSGFAYQSNESSSLVPMSAEAVSPAGGDQPHNNLPPVLVLHYVIALQGSFPPR